MAPGSSPQCPICRFLLSSLGRNWDILLIIAMVASIMLLALQLV